MNLATSLLAEIKSRGMDELFSMEESIVTGRQITNTRQMLEPLRALATKIEPSPTSRDLLRLVCVFHLSVRMSRIWKRNQRKLPLKGGK
jgi:hypothetical protein